MIAINRNISLKDWQIGLLAIGISVLGRLSAGNRRKKNIKQYEQELKQAPWAPPGWVFGPVWTINNFFLLMALQRVVNQNDMTRKKKLLALQGLIWSVYFSFGYVYFNKKSPVLGAFWTVADFCFAVTSYMLSKKTDTKLAGNYLPLVAWTGFASTVAVYQALKNPDPVLNIEVPAVNK